MLRCVWPAFNSFSNCVTFIAIVPVAYPEEAKMCKNVLKWRTFELRPTGWITGKRLKMGTCGMRLTNIESSFHPYDIYRDLPRFSQGRNQGEVKMCLRFSWCSQMPLPAKRVKATSRHTGVTLLAKLWLRLVFMQLTRDMFAIAKFLYNSPEKI